MAGSEVMRKIEAEKARWACEICDLPWSMGHEEQCGEIDDRTGRRLMARRIARGGPEGVAACDTASGGWK